VEAGFDAVGCPNMVFGLSINFWLVFFNNAIYAFHEIKVREHKMDEEQLLQHHKQVLDVLRERDYFLRYLKSAGGSRLSEAGRAFVIEALKRNERPSEIARRLGVTPAAISRYVNTA
jgi:hypothetical protein